MSNVEMHPRITTEYRPHEGRVIRIEEPMDEATRKAGVTAPSIELHPISQSEKPIRSVLATIIASFSFGRGGQAPEGWESRKAEWERQAKLEDIRRQLK